MGRGLRRHPWRPIALGCGGALGFVLVIGALLAIYAMDFAQRQVTVRVGATGAATRLDVSAQVVSVDPIKEEVVLLLAFAPQGDLTDDGGSTVNRPIRVHVTGPRGGHVLLFDSGAHMDPGTVLLSVDTDAATDYPFDDVELIVGLWAEWRDGTVAGSIPVASRWRSELSGMNVEFEGREGGAAARDGTEVRLSVFRTTTVRAFAVAVMIVMWAVGLTIVRLVYVIVRNPRRPDFTMVNFAAALIFGFWALRNSLPGTPPVGTLSDFLSFFWAEAIAASAIVILLSTWISRWGKD